MIKFGKLAIVALAISALVMGLSSCKKQEEGPAEKAGKKLDKAASEAKQQFEKTGEKVKEATKKSLKK
jgi:hypothetical protein